MTPEAVVTTSAPAAIGPYSQAIVAGGLLLTSGQLALIPGTGDLEQSSPQAEARRAISNALALVTAAGLTPRDVVKTTVYLTDLEQYADFNAVYEEMFAGWKPARSVVQVAGLPRGAQVEVELIALAEDRRDRP